MSSNPETRPRRNFGGIAKIADAPAQVEAGKERDEGSGVVHLAALEAAERASAPLPSLSPVAAPAVVVPKRGSGWGPMLAGTAAFAALIVGALVGSLGSTELRALLAGSPHPAAPPTVGATEPDEERPTSESNAPAIKPPLAQPANDAPEKPVAAPAPNVTAVAVVENAPIRQAVVSPAPSSAAPHAVAQKTPEALPPAATSIPATNLTERMEQAVGSDAPAGAAPANDGPAPTNPDGIEPVYPSLGAINSALARPLMVAQACVEGDVPISHARVRFDASGVVGNVAVTGWAAGKPAEACVREALAKARVAPFLQASYVVPVTIRSN